MIANWVRDSTIPQSNMLNLFKSVTGGLFQYNKILYTQIYGVSMGNPLAPTIASYFMGTIEKNLFDTEDENNTVLYLWYVDDIFCIFRKNVSFEKFNKKLNKLHKSINLTYELGGNKLPFFDINIKLTREEIITKIHKKEMDTDVILNFSAVAPTKWKRALLLWFVNKARIIDFTHIIDKLKITNLKEKLFFNCYPTKIVNN